MNLYLQVEVILYFNKTENCSQCCSVHAKPLQNLPLKQHKIFFHFMHTNFDDDVDDDVSMYE